MALDFSVRCSIIRDGPHGRLIARHCEQSEASKAKQSNNMLTEHQKRAREFKTTASQAPVIMAGERDELIRLWQERIGEIEPEDLSQKWPVALGVHCEPLILDWHERKMGMELTERGSFHTHPVYRNIGATLDAYRPATDTVIEAKTTGQFVRLDDAVNFYTPQVIVQMRCRNAAAGALLIMHGSAEPVEIPIVPDADYEDRMWERLLGFELCVQTMQPPVPLPALVPPSQWRSISLDDLPTWPNWAHEAALDLERWRDVRPLAIEFEEITAHIKALLPDDVGRLDYAGISVRRNRRGILTIREASNVIASEAKQNVIASEKLPYEGAAAKSGEEGAAP